METRTDPSVQAFQNNARVAEFQENAVLIAAAGATQGNATPIGEYELVLATATTSSQGLRLQPAALGKKCTVVAMSNRGVKVYPSTADRITAAASNAAITVPLNRAYTFIAQDATTWRVLRGAAS